MAPNTKTNDQNQPTNTNSLVGLPISVVGPVDVGRLIRELENIDNQLLQSKLRVASDDINRPKTTQLMDQTLELNKLDILKETDRRRLQELLTVVRRDAPVLHMSFSADPAASFIDKLMTWLRREIHPVVLLTIGLQPNIGAGCIVRSTNRQFDYSLRQDFIKQRDILRKLLAPEDETE